MSSQRQPRFPELDAPPVVDRCVCRNLPFAEMIRLNREDDLSLDDIADLTGATAQCSMCRPYARLALAAGRTALPVLTELTINRILADLEA